MTNLVYRCGYDTPAKVCVQHLKLGRHQIALWDVYTASLVSHMLFHAILQKYHALARVFGSAGGLFGREDEQQVFSAVADAGLGPRVLVRC